MLNWFGDWEDYIGKNEGRLQSENVFDVLLLYNHVLVSKPHVPELPLSRSYQMS